MGSVKNTSIIQERDPFRLRQRRASSKPEMNTIRLATSEALKEMKRGA
jgi:hypothetical protein